MDPDRIGSLIYLVLLGSVLVFWFFVQNRQTLNKTLQQISLWVLIFVGMVAVVGLWGDIRQSTTFRASVAESGEITIPRAPDGHYYLTLDINDAPVRFVVDTGATDMVLSRADAQTAGIDMDDLQFYARAATANGEVRVAPVRLGTVSIGPITDHDVPASVNDGDMRGSLLGMTYLERFGDIRISGGRMVLSR